MTFGVQATSTFMWVLDLIGTKGVYRNGSIAPVITTLVSAFNGIDFTDELHRRFDCARRRCEQVCRLQRFVLDENAWRLPAKVTELSIWAIS